MTHNLLAVDVQRSPADLATFQPSPAHSGTHPLDDQISFKFSYRPNDDDHCAAQRASGIDVFTVADKFDSEMAEFIEYFQEMPDAAGHPIKSCEIAHFSMTRVFAVRARI